MGTRALLESSLPQDLGCETGLVVVTQASEKGQRISKESVIRFIEHHVTINLKVKMIPFLVAEETEAQSWTGPQIGSVGVWCTQWTKLTQLLGG